MINKQMSVKLDMLKGLAIMSVICAHCNTVSDNYSVFNIHIGAILKTVGTIGVALLYILSGFLFERIELQQQKSSVGKIIKKKLGRIIIPWVFCGTLVYFYVMIRQGGISALGWLTWILGQGTYLYFLTVLMLMYIVFGIIGYNKKILYVLVIVSIISRGLVFLNVLDNKYYVLNIFNWIIFFIAGMVISNRNISLGQKEKNIALFIFGITLIVVFIRGSYFEYWSLGYWGFASVSSIGFLKIIEWIRPLRVGLIVRNLGRQSLAVYLLHMPFAGIVVNIFNRVDNGILTLSRPIIVLSMTMVCIKICGVIIKKLYIEDWGIRLLGIQVQERKI